MRRNVERHLGLFQDLRRNQSIIVGYDSTGINQAKMFPPIFGFSVNAIAGDAGLVANNGAAISQNGIKQSGFSDIRATHNYHGGQGLISWGHPLTESHTT